METGETFAELDRATLLELSKRRDGPGLVRLAVQLPWLIGSGVGLVLAEHPLAIAGFLVANAVAQATLFAPMHECAHRTAFASRWLNQTVAWITGFVQLSGPNGMRAFHFGHHRNTHDLASDPELGQTELLAAWPTGVLGLVNATGLPILLGRTMWMAFSAIGIWPDALWKQVMSFVSERDRPGVSRDSRLLVLAHLALIAWAALVFPPLFRLYAAMVVAHAILSVYLVAEHRGLPREGSVLDRTRSFAGNAVVDWLMWNMPYHAEHHGWPGVPFHALPALHGKVKDRLKHGDKRLFQLYRSAGS